MGTGEAGDGVGGPAHTWRSGGHLHPRLSPLGLDKVGASKERLLGVGLVDSRPEVCLENYPMHLCQGGGGAGEAQVGQGSGGGPGWTGLSAALSGSAENRGYSGYCL